MLALGRNAVWTLGVALSVVACGPSAVGDWTGDIVFSTEDGKDYVNELTVGSDKTADGTLYLLGPDPEDSDRTLLYEAPFDGTWEKSGGDAVFTLDFNGNAFEFTCELPDKDSMTCDSSPDFYTDDAAVLVWSRAE
jgi:hypothetical protein